MNLLTMAIKSLLTKLAVSLISEKFLEWAFFNIAERIVKSTETPHDDVWFEKIKESYKDPKE